MRVGYLRGPLELDIEPERNVPVSRNHRADVLLKRFPGANLGDWFVIRATVEAIDAEAAYTIARNADQASIDCVNAECDVFLLKGGNFIHRGFLETHIGLEFLKKIRIPIVYIGAGIQMPLGATRLDLTEEDIACLKYIHDSTPSCMVRGATTAQILSDLGIRNLRVCGCPTMFWSRRPELRVRPPARAKVGWSMRNGLYSADAEIHRAQIRAIARLRDTTNSLTVLLQGEELNLQRYHAFHAWGARELREREQIGGVLKTRAAAIDPRALEDAIYAEYGALADREVVTWLMNHVYFSYDISDYAARVAALDFVAGCRLHGNLLALSQGVPVYYFTYDARTQEIVDLFRIPGRPLAPDAIDVPWDALDYAPLERRYRELYGEYKTFLEENNIAHRLR